VALLAGLVFLFFVAAVPRRDLAFRGFIHSH
jgi:hypothetical protein